MSPLSFAFPPLPLLVALCASCAAALAPRLRAAARALLAHAVPRDRLRPRLASHRRARRGHPDCLRSDPSAHRPPADRTGLPANRAGGGHLTTSDVHR